MKLYDLVIVEQAIIEIEDSIIFYNNSVDDLGTEFNEAVFELLESIKINPLMFPVKFKQIREAVLHRFPFVIAYEVIEKEIVVLSVFHTKRNPEKKIRTKK